MRKILILFFCSIVSVSIFAQKKGDVIHFKDGEIIECYIVKVKMKNLFYFDLGTPHDVKKIPLDDIAKYEFNDKFFETNPQGVLEHDEVIKADGFSEKQIYIALEDWFLANSYALSNEKYIADKENFMLFGNFVSQDYSKIDLLTLLSLFDPELDYSKEFTLSYNIMVRAKEGRFKIVMNNFIITNSADDNIKTLKDIYEKRHTIDKNRTLEFKEIIRLRESLEEQIASMTNFCNDKESLRNYMLSDDDW